MMNILFDIIYPPRCPLCDQLQLERELCMDCRASLHFLEGDFTAPHLDRVWFDRARSCVAYEGRVMDAIHALKYNRRFDLVSFFADLLLAEAACMGSYDVVMPVPLHWIRLWKRGYNQSAMLARAVAKRLNIKAELSALKRIRNIAPQVGLDRKERLKNVKGAFDINRKQADRLDGARILLIDDVLTTGATVNECCKTIIKKGRCASIDILTIARSI